MSKVGLKETLTLLAAGYKKKDIDALAAIDEDAEGGVPGNNADPNPSAPVITDSAPAPAPDPEEKKIDPDMVKQMEELQAKLKESEEKLKKLQQDNVHKDSAPAYEEIKKKQEEDLQSLFRSYM